MGGIARILRAARGGVIGTGLGQASQAPPVAGSMMAFTSLT